MPSRDENEFDAKVRALRAYEEDDDEQSEITSPHIGSLKVPLPRSVRLAIGWTMVAFLVGLCAEVLWKVWRL